MTDTHTGENEDYWPWHHRYAPHMIIAATLPNIALAVYLLATGTLPLANAVVITTVMGLCMASGVYDIKTREVPGDD